MALAYQTYLALGYNSNDTNNTYLIIARVGSYNLLVLIAVLWLPVLRHTNRWVQNSYLKYVLPSHEMGKSLHRWLGHGLMLFAIVHGTFYLVYFDTLEGDFLPVLIGEEADIVRSMRTTMYEFVSEDESIEQIRQWAESGHSQEGYESVVAPVMKEDCTKCHSLSSTQTYAIPSLPLTDYESVVSLSQKGVYSRQFRINMTGLLMLSLFILIWATSLAILRNKQYHIFQKIHRLGYLVAILALLHIPRFEYCLAPSLLIFIELLLNRTVNFWPVRHAQLKAIGAKHVELNIPLSKPIQIPMGHYIQLRVPSIHKKEWHSLSLINSGDQCQQFELIVKDLGNWSAELCEHAQNESGIQVDVRGCYTSPMYDFKHHKDGVFFAGGVGITPVLSALNSDSDVNSPKSIRLVWVFQDWYLFSHIESLLLEWQQLSKRHEVYCYATTAIPEGMNCSDGIRVYSGRPNLTRHIDEWQEQNQGKNFAFVCGPLQLSKEISDIVKYRSGWKLAIEQF